MSALICGRDIPNADRRTKSIEAWLPAVAINGAS